MDYGWTVYVRDVFVILAAAALILVCGYIGLVAWQIYRLARDLGVELEPIVASAQRSAETVESTAGFLSGRYTTPATAASNTALGLYGMYQLFRRARADQAAQATATQAATGSPPDGDGV